METYKYTCGYCKKKFIPKRRKVQRFCSASCRVRSHQDKNKNISLTKPVTLEKSKDKTKIDTISTAGVVNAALGYGLVKLGKSIFTPEHQKSATKGDLKSLELKLVKRYHLVKNHRPHADGRRVYFDLLEGKLVYRWGEY